MKRILDSSWGHIGIKNIIFRRAINTECWFLLLIYLSKKVYLFFNAELNQQNEHEKKSVGGLDKQKTPEFPKGDFSWFINIFILNIVLDQTTQT